VAGDRLPEFRMSLEQPDRPRLPDSPTAMVQRTGKEGSVLSSTTTPMIERAQASPSYRICARCVMDTTDPDITFDERGFCHHCRKAEEMLLREPYCLPPEEKQRRLNDLVDQVRRDGQGKKYDCVIGISGGVDSTYVAYRVKELGLRALAVHLDNGWDSELAVANIEGVLKRLDIDLYTHVIDWEEFKDLQLAFLKASTPDSEIPTDHAIVSLLYRMAAREGLRHIIAGTNFATECIMPSAWSAGHTDWKYIKTLHARFGTRPLRTFPYRTLLRETWYRGARRIRWVSFLDYMDYSKEEAIQLLQEKLGWRNYGGKHYESIYTRFYQAHILPTKFGFDKRRGHLSAMIVSGQLTRERALEELKKPLYDPVRLKEDKEYVISKFGLSAASFEAIMSLPPKRFLDYPSYFKSGYYQALAGTYRLFKRLGWASSAP
jgi:N-acetyl sugar amidotransferase